MEDDLILHIYDETSPLNIERYSQKLIGKSFRDVLKDYDFEDTIVYQEKEEYFNNPRGKGSLGNLIEEYFFFMKPNSNSNADFDKAGVELKVTPIIELKNGKFSAGERLVLSMIPNNREIETDIEKSELFEKIALMLLIIYLREVNKPRLDNTIKFCRLFNLKSVSCEEDFEIIKQDYEKISYKVNNGLAHTLSEGDTLYLGACTKGANASKSLQPQYNSDILAKRRAFSFKQSYMTHVIRNFIIKDKDTYQERVIKDSNELRKSDFEEIVVSKINKYVNSSENDLMEMFNVNLSRSKDKYSLLTFKMLGVNSNGAEEFTKANIIVKTIRVTKNDKIVESMSFPYFKINELIKEKWEDSEIYEYFSETKFLFVIFKENSSGEYTLKGAQFWNMPMEDLEGIGKDEWTEVQTIFKNGIILKPVKQKNRVIMKNNLPGCRDTVVFHVRPHASKSYYRINGNTYGSGTIERDGDLLPNGDVMTKQCFWLNNHYVLRQISKEYL